MSRVAADSLYLSLAQVTVSIRCNFLNVFQTSDLFYDLPVSNVLFIRDDGETHSDVKCLVSLLYIFQVLFKMPA